MVKVVIASAVLYYMQLNFWWWIILFIAFAIDSYNEYANNMNDFRTVDHLRDISSMLNNYISKEKS